MADNDSKNPMHDQLKITKTILSNIHDARLNAVTENKDQRRHTEVTNVLNSILAALIINNKQEQKKTENVKESSQKVKARTTVISKITSLFTNMKKNVNKLFSSASLLISNSKAVANHFFAFFKNGKSFFKIFFKEMGWSLKSMKLDNLGKRLMSVVKNIAKPLDSLKKYLMVIPSYIGKVSKSVLNFIKNEWGWWKRPKFLDKIFNSFKTGFSKAWKTIGNVIKTTSDNLKNVFTKLTNTLKKITTNLKDAFKKLYTSIKKNIFIFTFVMKEIVTKIKDTFKDNIAKFTKFLKENKITKAVGDFFTKFSKSFKTAWYKSGMQGWFNKSFSWMKNNKASQGLKNLFTRSKVDDKSGNPVDNKGLALGEKKSSKGLTGSLMGFGAQAAGITAAIMILIPLISFLAGVMVGLGKVFAEKIDQFAKKIESMLPWWMKGGKDKPPATTFKNPSYVPTFDLNANKKTKIINSTNDVKGDIQSTKTKEAVLSDTPKKFEGKIGNKSDSLSSIDNTLKDIESSNNVTEKSTNGKPIIKEKSALANKAEIASATSYTNTKMNLYDFLMKQFIPEMASQIGDTVNRNNGDSPTSPSPIAFR